MPYCMMTTKHNIIDMKTVIFVLMTFLLMNCGQTSEKKNEKNKDQQLIQMAKKVKIDGLTTALENLKNGKTEYEFIGITSNGIDCIYFIYENGKFNFEFEAMSQDQIPYIERLKDFANSNDLKSEMRTYNNKPLYKSDKPAPVIRIETNYSLEEMAKFGEKIQSEIFKNNSETVYEIVP